MPNIDRLLTDLSGRYAKQYAEGIEALLIAKAQDNTAAIEDARRALADIIAETMGVAEVVGALSVLRKAAKIELESFSRKMHRYDVFDEHRLVRFASQSVLPAVTLEEALQDMVDRVPTTIRSAAERTAENIAHLYGAGSGGIARIAFVRSAEASVTKRVQSLIQEALREGMGELDAARKIVENVDEIRKRTKPWTEGYARMAFRTNVNTAVTAGRFRQVQDPDIKAVIPAFRYTTQGDVDVRPNHRADGMILRVDNPAWATVSPPLGYACRCTIDLVTLPELRRMGRVNPDGSIRESAVPAHLKPDPAFFRTGSRPDLGILGGV